MVALAKESRQQETQFGIGRLVSGHNGAVVPFGGVVTVAQPDAIIANSIRKAVADSLGTLPADAKGAIVGVGTAKGMNLAVAYKMDTGWEVAAWIGKSGWNAPVDGGVLIQKTWK